MSRDLWFDDLEGPSEDDPEAELRRARIAERARQRREGGRRGGPGSGRTLKLLAIGAGCVVVIGFLLALFQPFAGDGKGEPFRLEVPSGLGVSEIGSLLSEKGIIDNSLLFEARVTLSGKRSELYFGEHTFREDMSYSAVIDELGKAPGEKVRTVVVPEGLSRGEIAGVTEAEGVGGDYLDASIRVAGFDPNRYGAQGRARNLEGFLFPATYDLPLAVRAKGLVRRQVDAFRDNIAGVDFSYAKSKNLTIYDVLIIASMIEREVTVARERPIVAAVIYNRLERGEPLYIDATIRFATDNWETPLTESELAIDSPYNTRLNAGLPPGPIGSPGLASIEAAAKPAKTDVWLYVVQPGTCGEHEVSTTLSEHNRKVARYQAAQAEAGG
ncbi:MAG: endolytic transglycosylase MltG, partial [Solirubrobacterales bacterium]